MPTDFAEFYGIVCKLLPDPNHWNFAIIASSADSALSFLKTDGGSALSFETFTVTDETSRPDIAEDQKESGGEEELVDDSGLDGSKESLDVSHESDSLKLNTSDGTQEEETEPRKCQNCKTTTTRMWRRDKEGECMCK